MRLTARGRTVRDIALATLLTIPLAFAASLDAEAAPLPVQESVQTVQTVQIARDLPDKKPWTCKDKAATILHRAGFTGWSHKMAWAITYRESKHQNLDESSPWFSGALGFWQIQTSAHSSKPWWSRSAMLDPYQQSRIVYKHMTNKGKYWVPWGLNPDGSLNPSHYGSWGPSLWEAWIMAPFRTGLSLYPCKTTPPKKGNR